MSCILPFPSLLFSDQSIKLCAVFPLSVAVCFTQLIFVLHRGAAQNKDDKCCCKKKKAVMAFSLKSFAGSILYKWGMRGRNFLASVVGCSLFPQDLPALN